MRRSASILVVAVGLQGGPNPFHFENVTESSGIRSTNIFGGVSSKRYIIETTGNGAAFFDYDEDGDQDLFIVNGTRLDQDEASRPSNTLYRNNGDGTFVDVTAASGLEQYGWGQGASVSDIDNDGDLDLFITYYGPNRLYRNNGDGTFTEISKAAGLDHPAWGVGAAFADYDRDGVSDLFVANYVDFDPADTPEPGEAPNCFFMGIVVHCGPKGLPLPKHLLYHGRGDGTFEDVSGVSGVAVDPRYGLGAVWGDYDNDGDVDLYVTNDVTPNNLYENEGNGRFTDIALIAGVAYNEDGRAQAGMGVDFGDFDNDGWLDLHVTNFSHDHNALYRNTGEGYFTDVSFTSGVGEASFYFLGWGSGFEDFDRDGWLDIFIANGHVYPEVNTQPTESHFAQRDLLFRNLGDGRFREMGMESGPALSSVRVGRGAAFGDYDNDGDVDIAVVNMNDPLSLLRNESAPHHHWLGLRLIGRQSARDALGSRVTVTAGELLQIREVKSGSSYLSQNDLRILFGLGTIDKIDRVEIRWPSGQEQVLDDVSLNQYIRVIEPRPR